MSERELLHRDAPRRGPARAVATALAIGATVLAVVIAFAAYALGGESLAVGLPAALAAGSLALAVMLVARRLVAFPTLSEPRPWPQELPPLVEGDPRLARRMLAALGLAVGAALCLLLLPLPSIAPRPRRAGRTRWGRGVRAVDARGRFVAPGALRPGAILYPEGAAGEMRSMVIVASVDPLRAFSKVCTHAGCAVDLDASRGRLVCPCHRSEFSVAEGARVAGPAGKPLPSLPLATDAEGHLAASGDLDAPPGPTAG